MREGRVSIRSTEVVAHVIAYRAVASTKLIKSTWNKWCRSGIIFLSSLIVSLLAFSPKTQSGYKDKKKHRLLQPLSCQESFFSLVQEIEVKR